MILASAHCVLHERDDDQKYEANKIRHIKYQQGIKTNSTLLSCTEERSEDTDSKESSSSGCNLSMPN